MLLDMEIYFDHPGRIYYPGDRITCKIDVESTFKIKCKYVKVRLRCPYRKSNVEEFRIYEIANRRTNKTDKDDWNYKIGEIGLCFELFDYLFLEFLSERDNE